MTAELENICKQAVEVKPLLQKMSTLQKDKALRCCAEQLRTHMEEILEANRRDYERCEKNGMSPAMLDRLKLTDKRIDGMATGIEQVSKLPDPVGKILETTVLPNGLKLEKVTVPFGVIGIIYEARPNVTADAFSICFKAGSAAILKGGSDAIESNKAIILALQIGLETAGVPRTAVQLMEDTSRETAGEFMRCKDYVDLLIPRGGAGLIRAVVENSTIPVIETGTGNCHIYVDKDADFIKAIPIIINAKTQRIGVCNACESLVLHRDILDAFLPALQKALQEKQVTMRGDEAVQAHINCEPATEEDFGTEYLDYIISMKTVDSVEEAISHINHYSTGHSESILTENEETARQFLNEIDSACVYWNASTRFTDGGEFGFGAEIGISTQKLHARGPMGLRELTSYKYHIYGNGQIRP